jgi:hypothetical protein
MTELLSMRAYADRVGVNVSTISRQIARGRIPVIQREGERFIDPVAADKARARNSNRLVGHGGKPDRAYRTAARLKVRNGEGFTPEAVTLLNVLRAEVPGILNSFMTAFGMEPADRHKALAGYAETVEYLSYGLYDGMGEAAEYLVPVARPHIGSADQRADIDAEIATALDELEGGVGPDATGNPICDALAAGRQARYK